MSHPDLARVPATINYRRLAYMLPILISIIASGCVPEGIVIPKGSVEPIKVPPHSSPIYLNKPLAMDLAYHSGMSGPDYDDPMQVQIQVDVSGDPGVKTPHTNKTYTERTNADQDTRTYPFHVDITPEEDGNFKVTVQGRECSIKTTECGPWSDYSVDVVFDNTPPQILSLDAEVGVNDNSISGVVTDNLSSVTGVSMANCDGSNPNAAAVNPQGSFWVSFTPKPGDNCLVVQPVDGAGNVGNGQTVIRKYDMNVGLRVETVQEGKNLFVFGNLPDNVDVNTFKVTGEQARWKFFGLSGKLNCQPNGNYPRADMEFNLRCELPDERGNPAKIHITFTDEFGNQYDLNYRDKADLYAQIAEATTADKIIWGAELSAMILMGLITAGGIELGKRKYVQHKEAKARELKKRQGIEDQIAYIYTHQGYKEAFSYIDHEVPSGQYREQLKEWLKHRQYQKVKGEMARAIHGTDRLVEDSLIEGIEGLNFLLNSKYSESEEERQAVSRIFYEFTPILERWVDETFFDSTKLDWQVIKRDNLVRWNKIVEALRLIVHMQTTHKYSRVFGWISAQEEVDDRPYSLAVKLNDVAISYTADTNQLENPKVIRALVYDQRGVESMVNTLLMRGLFDALSTLPSKMTDQGQRHLTENAIKRVLN